MVATGTCLIDGFVEDTEETEAEVDTRVAQGLQMLERASSLGSPQGLYELGVCYYNGSVVEEDENRACELFRRAVDGGHVAGAFMYGDCLLEGVGVQRDQPAAVSLLHWAAMRGHRGARSRLIHLLEAECARPLHCLAHLPYQDMSAGPCGVLTTACAERSGQVSDGRFSDGSRQSYQHA
jgi:TPR repeat protein